MRYIRCHNANAKPFKWTYRNARSSHHPFTFAFQKLTALANYQVVSCWVFAISTSKPLQCGQIGQAVGRQHPTRCSAPSGVQISTAPKGSPPCAVRSFVRHLTAGALHASPAIEALEHYPKAFANGPARPYLAAGLSDHPISFWASPETKLPGLGVFV